MEYQERNYRGRVDAGDLVGFSLKAKESDLMVLAEDDLSAIGIESLMRHRLQLEEYIGRDPDFATTLTPWPDDPLAPDVVKMMIQAGALAGAGPMAAVAGAIATCVGRDLLEFSKRVIVENGGDVFLSSHSKTVVALWAGQSPLSGRVGIELAGRPEPFGVCTSSGTVGHSKSFGKADAVCIVAESAALGDAVATATANRIRGRTDFESAIKWALSIRGVQGALAVIGEELAAGGEIELVRL